MLVVQKYGGSSVAALGLMKRIASRIAEHKEEGRQLVVVVSAMGDETDALVDMARRANKNPDPREMDVLLSTGEQKSIALMSLLLQSRGLPAVSLVGGQARIVTDHTHGKARIVNIDVSRIHRELEAGKVVVVAGFQGVTEDHEITTLGRGGSDLTAVALAAALKADLCEIYTDVEGVYPADPNIVENVRKIDKISYDEMLELASSGAQVMQARSIEFAHNYGVRIHVRAQHGLTTGTIITSEEEVMEQVVYRGVALDKEASKFSILGIPDIPGIAARIFGRLAEHQIVVDMIVQSAARRGYNDITFTVHQDDFEKTLALVDQLVEELEAEGRNYDRDIAKITAVGAGMRTRPGVAATMFKALADADINIDVISTSEMKISCVVKRERGEDGVRAVHRAFGLEGPK
jgi:aspartate kinase